MTRMERRRRRARRRRLKILVAAVAIALLVSICNAFVTGAYSDDFAQNEESTHFATTLDYQENAYFREIGTLRPITLEMAHTLPIQDEHTIIVKSEEDVEDETEPDYEKLYTDKDVIAMAQMAYGEGWITQSDTEMSWSMWCVCNRLDSGDPFYRNCDSIYDIITQDGQFHGYDPNNPIEDRLVDLAEDVLDRWSAEKQGATDVGRTLPEEYLFFFGDGRHNHFTTEWQGGIEYDGHLGSPYEN